MGRPETELMETAKKAYARPLILTADKIAVKDGTTLVLPNTALRFLMFDGKARDLFREGKVVIVTDAFDKKPRRRR